jgi:hypothetical protein
VRWSTSGSGVLRASNGGQTRDASWIINAGADVQFRSQVIASTGRRMVSQNVAAVRVANGLTGWQQLTIGGVPQTPGAIGAEAFEFDYGALSGNATDTQLAEMKRFTNVLGLGYQAPGGTGTSRVVDCQWNFQLGPSP